MFDHTVEKEGVGRAETVEGGSPDGLGQSFDPGYQQAAAGQYQQAAAGQYPQAAAGGLGAYVEPLPDQYPPAPVHYGQAVGGEIDFIEPTDTSSGAAMKSAGFTLLFVALTSGIGYAWKGGLGASAGFLGAAGLANAYRAQKNWSSADPSEKHEAMVSAIFAAGELFTAGFVGYHAVKRAEKRRE